MRCIGLSALVLGIVVSAAGQRDQEVMGALVLDIRHRLLGAQEIFRGT